LGEGKPIDEVVRHLDITESTWHRWRNQYGGMKATTPRSWESCARRTLSWRSC